jgi:hypothetical protein
MKDFLYKVLWIDRTYRPILKLPAANCAYSSSHMGLGEIPHDKQSIAKGPGVPNGENPEALFDADDGSALADRLQLSRFYCFDLLFRQDMPGLPAHDMRSDKADIAQVNHELRLARIRVKV